MVPAVGLVFWLAHVVCYILGRLRLIRPFWVFFWAWLAGLPVAVVFCLFYLSSFVSHPPSEVLFQISPAEELWQTNIVFGVVEWMVSDENTFMFSREQAFWLTSAAWCLAEWVVFLVVEPPLLYAIDLVFRRLDRTADPHRPE